MTYRIFGVLLDSDVPLPELPRASGRSCDIAATLRRPPRIARKWDWIDQWETPDGVPWLRIGKREEGWLLRFPRLADFLVTAGGRAIACRPRVSVPPRTIRHLLIDQVVPLVLSARGHVLLHASAVATGRGAVLFAGPTGAGKSTLAFALAGSGCRLLSDDTARVEMTRREERPSAVPAYPGARLWPDVLDAFRLRRRARQLAHYSPKRRVMSGATASARSVPIRCIYLLAGGPSPEIRTVPARAALVELLKQTYTIDVRDHRMERQHFDTLASICGAVPVRRLAYPRELSRLQDVVGAILSDH